MIENADIDPNTPLGKLSLRARRVPAFIRIPLLLVGLAATLTCSFADLPPYSLFADAQASIMNGEHYYMLSFMLTAAVFMMPIGITIHVIATFFPPLPPVAYPGYGAPGPAYSGQAPFGAPHGQGPYGAGPAQQQPGYGQPTYGQPPYAQAPSAQPQNQADPAQQGPSGQAPWGQGGGGPGVS